MEIAAIVKRNKSENPRRKTFAADNFKMSRYVADLLMTVISKVRAPSRKVNLMITRSVIT